MPWVKIDEQFPRHPKIAAAGPLGMALQVAALCYCNEYLTDGFIPTSVAKTLLNLDGLAMHVWKGEMIGGGEDATPDLVINDVINAGLWIDADGGWQIHDYHDFQPSKAEVLELREGTFGGWIEGRTIPMERRLNSKCHGNQIATAMARAMAKRWQSYAPYPYPFPF